MAASTWIASGAAEVSSSAQERISLREERIENDVEVKIQLLTPMSNPDMGKGLISGEVQGDLGPLYRESNWVYRKLKPIETDLSDNIQESKAFQKNVNLPLTLKKISRNDSRSMQKRNICYTT